jgi:uncharacterized membrane protein YkvA (DUF1232 family)
LLRNSREDDDGEETRATPFLPALDGFIRPIWWPFGWRTSGIYPECAANEWCEDEVMASPISSLMRPWLLKALLRDVRLAIRLIREPRVPMLAKAVAPLAAIYLLSPIDVLPDLFPVLGQLDDLVVVYGALKLFLRLCPPAAVAFHDAALAARRPFSRMSPQDVVIDAEFRRQ